MVGLSSAGEAAVLNAITTSVFVSLHTADPNPTPPGTFVSTEVSGGAYARLSAAFTQSGADPTVAANSGILTFPTATASWGTVSHFALWTALTGGTFLGAGALLTPKAVNSGDVARFAAGALTVTAQ